MGDDFSDDIAERADEIEALAAIFEGAMTVNSDDNSVDFTITSSDSDSNNEVATLHVALPPTYPSRSPPSYELSAPFLSSHEKVIVLDKLEEVAEVNIGQPMLFTWVEAVREFLEERKKSQEKDAEREKSRIGIKEVHRASANEYVVERAKCPEIITGDCIEDRKSVFQGHFARVSTLIEVRAVMDRLLENRKIANATHNIYAYRIRKECGTLISDCDDDGESQAGGRVAHLLAIVDAENVMVVVSRWYGGIKLGPDRFKHISNAARKILERAGVIAAKHQQLGETSGKSKSKSQS